MEIGEEIVIGQLGQQPNKITDPTVAPQHAKLKRIDASRYQITDLDSPQGVIVFGMKVVRKTIKGDTPIFIGKYKTTVNDLMFDVTQLDLAKVWDSYNDEKMKWERYTMMVNSIRMLTPVLTIGLGVLFNTGNGEDSRVISIVITIIVVILINVIAMAATQKLTNKKTIRMGELTNKLQKEYVCHHCHRYFGTIPYTVLKQNRYCPSCGYPI